MKASTRGRATHQDPFRCSFCGKKQEDVRRLIAGPCVNNGNECVELCREIISEEDLDASTPGGEQVEPQEPVSGNAQIANRKADHIRICLEEDVSGRGITAGFERYRFLHQALPEINLGDVGTSLEW